MKILAAALFFYAAAIIPAAFAAGPRASPERVVREFYAYLAASDHYVYVGPTHQPTTINDIGTDTAAQDRWLTRQLRESLRRANASIRREHPKAGDQPTEEFNSASVRFGWDPPGAFVIKHTALSGDHAVVSGLMVWGPKQQYAGSIRKAAFFLKLEDGAWRVDDIRAEPYKFNDAHDCLTDDLRRYQ